MSLERKIFLRDVGEVIIRKRRNAKRLSISINRHAEVKMTVPLAVSYRDAERFLTEKKDWMVKTLRKIEAKAETKKFFKEGVVMETRHHTVVVERNGDPAPCFKMDPSKTMVYFHHDTDITSDEMQAFIRRAVTETLRVEAQIELIPRTRALSEVYGFRINRVTVKDLKSRWGSCSNRNNINLNIHLMRLPAYLADYVILHELVHTVHHNHSPAFWDELGRYVRDPRRLSRELRKYHPEIA